MSDIISLVDRRNQESDKRLHLRGAESAVHIAWNALYPYHDVPGVEAALSAIKQLMKTFFERNGP